VKSSISIPSPDAISRSKDLANPAKQNKTIKMTITDIYSAIERILNEASPTDGFQKRANYSAVSELLTQLEREISMRIDDSTDSPNGIRKIRTDIFDYYISEPIPREELNEFNQPPTSSSILAGVAALRLRFY
jgi:hypothetical protein